MNLINVLEKIINEKGLTLTKGDKYYLDSVKAYFKGKDDTITELKKIMNDLQVFDENELAQLQDKYTLIGFEKGKELILNNLKIYLNLTSGKTL